MARRNPAVLGRWGVEAAGGTRVVASEAQWRAVSHWDRAASEAGERRRVFVASLADVFDDWSGPLVDSRGHVLNYNSAATWWIPGPSRWGPIPLRFVRDRLASLVRSCHSLDFLFLTKRIENAGSMLREMFEGDVPPNLWLGVTCEDQRRADERVPILLDTPAAIHWVSAEPLLGPIEFAGNGLWDTDCRWCLDGFPDSETGVIECRQCDSTGKSGEAGVDWLVVGGESGPNRRPMEVDWLRSIVDQCRERDVPVFVKQDNGPRDGMQGRIPDDLWSAREYPRTVA